jgi:peroxiredoxin
MNEPTIGQDAPDFTAKSTSGETVSLSQFKGSKNVLLAFFPLAFTSVCTAQNNSFSDEYSRFENASTVVVPISVDSVPALKEWKAKHRMAHELASDFKRDIGRAYGVLDEEAFFTKRAYFLIDKRGKVAWKHVEDQLGDSRSNEELLAQIARLS